MRTVQVDGELPYLDIQGPASTATQHQLSDRTVSIGRLPGYNDITLQPDPQHLVSRVSHCRIERNAGSWWIVDGGSRNGAYLQSGDAVERINGRAPLTDGTTVCIFASLPGDEQPDPAYWRITFRDPASTRAAVDSAAIHYLQYDPVEARLYRVSPERIDEIDNLRPQEHQLVRYMNQRNQAAGYAAAMCGHDELIDALWGDDGYDHTESEVARIIWSLRQKIEPDASEPQILQTVRGLGYRLVTRPHRAER